MSNETDFNWQEIPFDKLSRLGISREDVDRMPPKLRESLFRGDVTPIIEANVVTSSGKIVTIPVRLQLLNDGNDRSASLMVYPMRPELENTLGLSHFEMERVRSGEVIQKDVLYNGMRFPEMVQLDPRTNSLVHARVADLKMEQEIANLESVKDIQLGTQQKDAIREGRPIELKVGDEKVTVGVNLTEPQGFKVIRGDMEEWKRQEEARYDLAHPEVMGFVKTDRNRWEYQQVVDHDSNKRAASMGRSQGEELTRDGGLKL